MGDFDELVSDMADYRECQVMSKEVAALKALLESGRIKLVPDAGVEVALTNAAVSAHMRAEQTISALVAALEDMLVYAEVGTPDHMISSARAALKRAKGE